MMDATDFLQKDYELKANYLAGHLSRMWTRFNFFLTIESALLAFSFDADSAIYAGYLAIAGLLLSSMWYWFAAADNFLVDIYRGQLAYVFELLSKSREAAFKAAGIEPSPKGYSYVGSISDDGFDPEKRQVEPIKQNIWRHRSRDLSVTELGVGFAFMFSLLWVGRLILWFVN